MKQLVRVLGLVLAGCLVVDILAAATRPLIPVLALLFVSALLVLLVFGRTER